MASTLARKSPDVGDSETQVSKVYLKNVDGELEKGPKSTEYPPNQVPSVQSEAYSVFTTKQKKLLVLTASLASFFSPLSGSIYYPALNTIANDLGVTAAKANLTVTTYMVSSLVLVTLRLHLGLSPVYA